MSSFSWLLVLASSIGLVHPVRRGAEQTTLRAGLGYLDPNGMVHRRDRIPQNISNSVPKEADNCGGLEEMAVGARVMLRSNIGTEDGLRTE